MIKTLNLACSLMFAAGMVSAQAVKAGTPASQYQHRQFSVDATLYSQVRDASQPAVLKVSFDLEVPAVDVGERSIRNLDFTLEALPAGSPALPGYTMASLGSGSKLDFYPSDTDWGKNNLTYVKTRRDYTDFIIEAKTNIDTRAAKTVLDAALTRMKDGTVYGAKALLKINLDCSKDLTSCSVRPWGGVWYDHWNGGFIDTVEPDFLLLSNQSFSLAD